MYYLYISLLLSICTPKTTFTENIENFNDQFRLNEFNNSVVENFGDFVWHDLNGDGIQDLNEPGIPNVEVLLYDEYSDFVQSVMTNSNGNYSFENVVAGMYYLVFQAPEDYESTFSNTTDSDKDSDITNSIVNASTNSTDLFEVTQGQDNFNIDAGFYICASIGETVWYDVDADSVKDSIENGINGLKVTLWRFKNDSWEEWEQLYTGHKPGTPSDDGYFKFCAPPGTYYLHFDLPPLGLVQVEPNVGNDLYDSDVTNEFGPETTSAFTITSGGEICTIGAGYYPMAEIGNYVWEDINTNGIQDEGEQPLQDVLVQAYDLEGILVAEVRTDINGEYILDYLKPDTYYIKFTPPLGYVMTQADIGNEETDSDVTSAFGPNTTNAYTLNSGDRILIVDAGMFPMVLPVEWHYVKVSQEGRYNLVKWATSVEIKSDYFEVERGRGDNVSFISIGTVKSEGSTSGRKEYSFKDDNSSQTGTYYYRIKQIDEEGRVEYSDIVSVTKEDVPAVLSIFPNPTSSSVVIKLIGSVGEVATVSIFTKDGRLIESDLFLNKVSIDNYQLTLDVSTFLPGVYKVQVESKQKTWTENLIVL